MKYKAIIISAFMCIPAFVFLQSPAGISLPAIPLTGEQHYFMNPEWSPDGSTIAATTTKYTGIYLITVPDGSITRLTDDLSAGFGMQWTQGGTRIVSRIAKYDNKRRYNAIAMYEVGSGQRTLLSEYATLFPGVPKITENGQFVYMSGTHQFKYYQIPQSSSVQSVLPESTVLFVQQGRIRSKRFDSQSSTVVSAPEGEILNLVVSPDRTKIAYEVYGGNLYVSDVDGTNRVDLGKGYEPAWSPNSDQVVFMETEDDGHMFTHADIITVYTDGSGRKNITHSPDLIELYPSWSPNGTWIAYTTQATGQIYIQELE